MSDDLRHNYYFGEPPSAKLAVLPPPEGTSPAEEEPATQTGRPVNLESVAQGAGEESAADKLRRKLKERVFDVRTVPPKVRAILKLAGKTIVTPGNISGVQALPKAGKTTVVQSMIAAFFCSSFRSHFDASRQDPDTLSFTAENPKGRAVVVFDTEQSLGDHDSQNRCALRRAKVDKPPDWYYSYCVTDMDIEERLRAVAQVMEDAQLKHGGVELLVLDGVADFCKDPNDPAESFALVGYLHALAIKYDCAVLYVIHENPGGGAEGKTRGHLGSQLERKAETPLRLAKDSSTGVTTMWSDRARHCHLPKEEGVCFRWSDEEKMHISAGSAKQIKATAKASKARTEAEAAFGDSTTMAYSELVAAIMDSTGLVKSTAERRVRAYTIEGIVLKNPSGTYSLKP